MGVGVDPGQCSMCAFVLEVSIVVGVGVDPGQYSMCGFVLNVNIVYYCLYIGSGSVF